MAALQGRSRAVRRRSTRYKAVEGGRIYSIASASESDDSPRMAKLINEDGPAQLASLDPTCQC
ncbi:hypothetical protein NOU13_24530 [Rhodococcus erythropolis]|nr:hypothetical protein [Rhodococcus erythropolis]